MFSNKIHRCRSHKTVSPRYIGISMQPWHRWNRTLKRSVGQDQTWQIINCIYWSRRSKDHSRSVGPRGWNVEEVGVGRVRRKRKRRRRKRKRSISRPRIGWTRFSFGSFYESDRGVISRTLCGTCVPWVGPSLRSVFRIYRCTLYEIVFTRSFE